MSIRYVGAVVAVLVVALGLWWVTRDSFAPEPSVDLFDVGYVVEKVATSSDVEAQEKPATQRPSGSSFIHPFPLVAGEVVTSWDFKGSHKDGGLLEARVRAEVEKMKGLLDSGASNKYELYVSIANQYDMLGDGKKEYEYLGYALAIDAEKTGLAWRNMGKLLERLGAYKSARVAYDRMVQAQPFREYALTRLEFLKARIPEDTTAIAQAEAAVAASQD